MYHVHESDRHTISDGDRHLIAGHVRRLLTDWIYADADAGHMPDIEPARSAIYAARDLWTDNGGAGVQLPFSIDLPAIGDHPAYQGCTLSVTNDGKPNLPRLIDGVHGRIPSFEIEIPLRSFPGPTIIANLGA